MQICFITFRSVTPAQRAEQLLRREGFICHIRRTPRWMESNGCGYALQVRLSDVVDAVKALSREAISYRKVYLLGDHGRAEEMTL